MTAPAASGKEPERSLSVYSVANDDKPRVKVGGLGKKSRPDLFRKGTCGAAHYVRGCQKHNPRVNKRNTSHLKPLKKNAGRRPRWDGLLCNLMNGFPFGIGGRMASSSIEHPSQRDRSWQEIATELSQETDPDKMTDLATELNDALDKEEKKRRNGQAA